MIIEEVFAQLRCTKEGLTTDFRDTNIHTNRWQQPTGIIQKLQADPKADSNISFIISPH
jgi:hypothetical protein